MQEQEKESLLLVQDSDLSEYSLLNVRGMDAAEIVEALSAMNDDDRLSAAAYLESKGAWITEIGNEQTKLEYIWNIFKFFDNIDRYKRHTIVIFCFTGNYFMKVKEIGMKLMSKVVIYQFGLECMLLKLVHLQLKLC